MEHVSALQFSQGLLQRFPDPDSYPYTPWSYPQGYLLMGFAKLYEATAEERFLAYIQRYCDQHVDAAGTIKGFTGCSMDDMMAGAILAWMYAKTGEEKLALACQHIYASFADYPRTREGGFLHNRDQRPGEMWVDGVFMGQMFLCRFGKVFHQPGCFAETAHQLGTIYRYCHAHSGLLVHAYSEDQLAPWALADGKAREVWSEGLGWYALILAEALDLIPEGAEGRGQIARQMIALLEGLKKTQDPVSGLWFQVVDKGHLPDNWCDTSGSAMFYYALRRAVSTGLVPAEAYAQTLQRAYQGLQTRIVPAKDGAYDILTACEGLCVQNAYEDYVQYPQTVNAQEAVCGMLWALVAHDFP